jgi:hypothetical protein
MTTALSAAVFWPTILSAFSDPVREKEKLSREVPRLLLLLLLLLLPSPRPKKPSRPFSLIY